MTDVYLVVGLGNPGPKYAANRHNVGQVVVELLAARCGVRLSRHPRAQAEAAEGRLSGHRVVLARPMTFMNVSGGPVSALTKYYGIPPKRVVAVHDDVDLPFETVKCKLGGGEGGHNGLRDLTKALGTRDYLRVRVGVGRPPGRMDTADYVLRDFSAAERANLPMVVDTAADAVTSLLSDGLLATQQRFHPPRPD